MERSVLVVYYQGARIGDSEPFDHLGIITKNFRVNDKEKLTLGQVVNLLFNDPNSCKVWGNIGKLSGSAPIDRGEIVSITLFAKDLSRF